MTQPNSRLRRTLLATRLIACAGLLAFAAHTGLGLGGRATDSLFDDWVYNGLVIVAAGWCVARAVLVRADRAAWALIALGLGCWATAEILNTAYLAKLDVPPYPSIADGFWLAFYPTAYMALILLVRGRMQEFRRSLWLDGIVAGLAVASLGEVLFVHPILEATGGRSIEVATDLSYPLCDVLMLALVIGVFALTGWRPGRAWGFIGAGLMSMAAADSIYAYEAAKGMYVEGTALDALWPAATLLVGWAAWVPTRQRVRLNLHGWRPLVLPTGFGLIAVGVLVYDHFEAVDTAAVLLAGATMVAVLARTAMTFGENLDMLRSSRTEALTDALTALGNRRALTGDLAEVLEDPGAGREHALVLFDLDGFKHYNDSFGHPAGDDLLARLGRSLELAVADHGRAYRLGGDEFCALVEGDPEWVRHVIEAAARALTEHGQGFQVAASHGVVLLPGEASDVAAAMQIADQRLYGNKGSRRRSSIGQQTRDVLLQILRERGPALHDDHQEVAALAVPVAERLGMLPDEVDVMVRAAELHDIGQMVVPDQILMKPGPLDGHELDVIRQHTLAGERILAAAPSLQPVARLVRTSHEWWDGSGYPDGLAGDDIPRGARVIAVCDAYHAMTSARAYRSPATAGAALDELRACAGSHFDPRVVQVFREVWGQDAPPAPGADADPLPRALREAALEDLV